MVGPEDHLPEVLREREELGLSLEGIFHDGTDEGLHDLSAEADDAAYRAVYGEEGLED